VQRFKELFDIEALAKTFCNEVGALVIVGHRWSVLEIMGNIWMCVFFWIAPRNLFVSNHFFSGNLSPYPSISHIQKTGDFWKMVDSTFDIGAGE